MWMRTRCVVSRLVVGRWLVATISRQRMLADCGVLFALGTDFIGDAGSTDSSLASLEERARETNSVRPQEERNSRGTCGAVRQSSA